MGRRINLKYEHRKNSNTSLVFNSHGNRFLLKINKTSMEKMEKYLRERIKQLNEADAAFCEKRWDMSQPEMVRNIYREQSNAVTLARQELEQCLTVLGLPRFLEEPIADTK